MKVEMKYVKATKNTFVYVDDREEAPIPSLYIKKADLPKPAPEVIKVEVTYGE